MTIIKIYVNGIEKNIPYTSISIKNSIKNYISQSTITIPNPNNIYGTLFVLNTEMRIDLYDNGTTAWIKKIEGYISNIEKNDTKLTMDIEITQHTGRMYERRVNEVYSHQTAYNIINHLCGKYLPTFTKTNIDYDGTDTADTTQASSNGTVTLAAANLKYAQRITPGTENIVKIDLYFENCTGAIADIQLRAEDTAKPSDYDILQRMENVDLVNGINTINLTRKFLDTALNYWIVIIWKGGTFDITKQGTTNTGRVASSSASPESWATVAIDDIKFTTYSTNAKIIETFKLPQKQLAEAFEDIVKIFTTDWIYYIDNDKDIHWELETFGSSSMTLNDNNIFSIKQDIEGRKIFNNITIMGGEEITSNSTDSFLGNGTQKTFSFSAGNPIKPLKKLTVNGVIKIEDTDFVVDYVSKKLTFTVAPGNGLVIAIIHDYSVPVIANSRSNSSIAKHGQKDYVKSDKNIQSKERAKEIADGLLRLYSGEETGLVIENFIYPVLNAGLYVTVENTRLGINDNYLISEISFEVGVGGVKTKLTLANEEIVSIPDVLKELKARIEEVQMAQYSLDAPITEMYDLLAGVNFTAIITGTERWICDSYILGHSSSNGILGRGKILDLFTEV